MNTEPVPTLKRRQFLTKGVMAASAVAFPYFIPASALGRNGTVAPSNRIVMAGIGIGGRGTGDLNVMLGHITMRISPPTSRSGAHTRSPRPWPGSI